MSEKVKLPDYVVRDVFTRVVTNPGRVGTSHRFVYRGNCPVCGEKRQRMYVKDYGDDHMVYCHNCSYSKPFRSFLKDYFPEQLPYIKQFILDAIRDGSAFKQKKEKRLKDRLTYTFSQLDVKLRMYARKFGFPITKKQDDPKLEKFRRKCIKYFKSRKLSTQFIKKLVCFVEGPLCGYCGIPFEDRDNNIIHWQGRRMWEPVKGSDDDKHNPKYKFLKDEDQGVVIESKPFYNDNKVNPKRKVQITEGAVDAEAFSNAIATSGATISETLIRDVKKRYPKRVWVPDNIWIDNAGRELAEKLLLLGESVFAFPFGTPQKDANSYIIDNDLDAMSDDFVTENTYTGRMGLIKLRSIAIKKEFTWQVEKKNGRYLKSSKGNS